jgi:hypothetical protein
VCARGLYDAFLARWSVVGGMARGAVASFAQQPRAKHAALLDVGRKLGCACLGKEHIEPRVLYNMLSTAATLGGGLGLMCKAR